MEECMSIEELLRWIAQWMCDNDYECGNEGSDILDEIYKHLKEDK